MSTIETSNIIEFPGNSNNRKNNIQHTIDTGGQQTQNILTGNFQSETLESKVSKKLHDFFKNDAISIEKLSIDGSGSIDFTIGSTYYSYKDFLKDGNFILSPQELFKKLEKKQEYDNTRFSAGRMELSKLQNARQKSVPNIHDIQAEVALLDYQKMVPFNPLDITFLLIIGDKIKFYNKKNDYTASMSLQKQ